MTAVTARTASISAPAANRFNIVDEISSMPNPPNVSTNAASRSTGYSPLSSLPKNNNTLFIIECKHQEVAGSVDEKLQTCDFKKKQYKKLMAPANIDVEYIYLLDNWFTDPKYKDVLDYILSVGCDYYFEYIPLARLGLPVPDELITD